MKNIVIIVFVFVTSISFSQNLSQYKYALIPSKFSFLKEPNQYRLNVLAKLYMEKFGFETYIDDEKFPEDFSANNTNKLYVDVAQNNNMFNTKIKIVLKDFQNNILFTSSEGVSRDKENTVAYNQAFRMAFDNFTVLKNHKFDGTKKSQVKEVSNINNKMENVIPPENTVFAQPISDKNSIVGSYNLYTSATNDPQLVMQINKTSVSGIYFAVKNAINGILLHKNKNWYFEYYEKNILISEIVYISSGLPTVTDH